MTTPAFVLVSEDNHVLHVTFNRPESRNAMSPEMLGEIEAVFSSLPEHIRAVVLRGSGGHFCAGADLKGMMASGMKKPLEGQPDPIAQMNRAFGTMLRQVANCPAVVITVCEGAVLGGGFGLACVSDVGLTHAEAKFGLPETTRGLPPAQIAPFVVERIGLTQARRLALTGAQFRGLEAVRLGIAHDHFSTAEEGEHKLAEVLKAVRSCAPNANRITKQILLDVGKQDLDAVLDSAAAHFAACARGAEAPEGIMAFMQKRAPKWA
jgi:isohexenylglutaconyl-CoA hydratase